MSPTSSGRFDLLVPGTLRTAEILALADSGSDLDIMSIQFAHQHGFAVDSSQRQEVRLPRGSVKTVGTVTMPFKFNCEDAHISRTFHVLPSCSYPIVFGSEFLKVTETLTKFTHRLIAKYTPRVRGFRFCLVNSPKQRIVGTVNGRSVSAIPDTGSDVMVLSWRMARKLGLHIHSGLKHRTLLEFADGSQSRTYGMVFDVEWKFPGSSKRVLCNFHVLKGLPYEVVLSNDFLHRSNVFSGQQDGLLNQESRKRARKNLAEFSLIREIVFSEVNNSKFSSILRKLRRRKKSKLILKYGLALPFS
jgi:hypothetical protein